jgi:tetratricopeptide (TPR) repeat protein
LQIFEQAMRLFHARKLAEARALFIKAAEGGERHIAHKARLHVNMCDRRLEQQTVELSTPEDHYNYAVTQINARNLERARQHLETALAGDSGGDHLHYALAACHALAGNGDGAYQHLKRAIELEPKNRIAARQDADFTSVLQQPEFNELLNPEKKR